MTAHKLAYGKLICGKFNEPIFATGPADLSPPQSSDICNGYDSRCSSCYLHFGHTQEYHSRQVNANRLPH